jgi:glyoxylase-like metal-dependent hydrolase (beta-lactamase superfamily II)
MERRTFLKSSTALLGTFSFAGMQPFSPLHPVPPADEEVVKIKIGAMQCTIFRDFLFKYQAKDFFINADPQELAQSLARYQAASGTIPSPFIAVLLRHGDRNILIDSGVGFSEKPVTVRGTAQTVNGRLHPLLRQENVAREDITDVIITHFHPDHIGGLFSEAGEAHFPNARFHAHGDEWQYWHTSQSDGQPAPFKQFIARNITPLKGGNLNLVSGDFVELLPGVTAVKADGHTPGQIALAVGTGKERLLYISDAFLHPLHVERTDWQTNYDLDHGKARQTRLKLLDLAHRERMLVNAFHFDFPGLGRVGKRGNGWNWQPTAE